ncbi:MAG TPA: zinc ribbon domain-containing protein [Anaerolineales bacterium]|nr:zinc ribbon domain-containing protein [Anaerolineales bacterium]
MRRWLISFLALFLVFPAMVHAQGNITLESVKVRLWSEYDQPSMLVIYDFKVAEGTTLPTTLDLRIPNEGNLIAVAYEEGGELFNADFSGPVEDGNWQRVTLFIKSQTTYHLEYYQPLGRDGKKRLFTYQWGGEYAVQDFSIEIQVPEDSTGVQTIPAIPFVREESFLSGGAKLSDLEAGETYQVRLQYTRSSEATVIQPPSAQIEPSEPIDTDTEGRVTLDKLPYILGGIGALLIIAALYYSWRVNSFHLPRPRQRHRPRAQESAQVYCHECGARAQPGDRFCRSCGSRLRTD